MVSCAHSDISTFSFHPVKSITTCEGGAITTNIKKIYNKISLLRSIGLKRSDDHWDYNVEELSLNFRLSDVQCALGINQLKNLNKFIKKGKKFLIFIIKISKIIKIFILSNIKKIIILHIIYILSNLIILI